MNDLVDRRRAFLILNGLPNVGPISLSRLLLEFGSDASAILNAAPSELMRVRNVGAVAADCIAHWREHFDPEREEEKLRKHGTDFVSVVDDDYPRLLKEIHDPPIGLYVHGGYRPSEPCIAIVGTRRPTLYGRAVARRLASDLARMGFCIVSGMARGIDTEAHEGALKAEGKTMAVFGCGLDIIYPPENLELYRRISQNGAVVSEFPFGRRADRQTFPMRNRVVSGICEATVIVESDVHGGSMITARFAGEQGREVFAVPGRIDQAASRGTNQLIRDGAILLRSVDDLIDEFRYLGKPELALESSDREPLKSLPEGFSSLSDTEEQIMGCLADGSIRHTDDIAARTGLPLPEVSSNLLLLELKRVVAKRADGSYECTSRA